MKQKVYHLGSQVDNIEEEIPMNVRLVNSI